MRPEAIAEILRLTAPDPPQQDDEFTVKKWMEWAADSGAYLSESAARERLKKAVALGEFTTRVTSNESGRIRVFKVVE